jgi:hypothetical protein
MSSLFSPIAIFCYRRADHAQRAISALARCPEFDRSPLIVFFDGPKHAEDESDVLATRRTVRDLLGDRATYVEAEQNKGLANSIIDGVSQVCDQYGQTIVIEDDLVVDRGFLAFMNAALARFRDDPKVMQISGYMFPVESFRHRTHAVYLPFTTSWGWATWSRAWRLFDPLASGAVKLQSDSALRRRFNLDGAYNYARMLELQLSGQIDSWAIRWNWTVFSAGGLVVYPPQTLVENMGFDGSGTHGFRSVSGVMPILECDTKIAFPDAVEVSDIEYHQVKHAVRLQFGGPIGEILRDLRYLFGRFRFVLSNSYREGRRKQ